jgi:hypothetical protein
MPSSPTLIALIALSAVPVAAQETAQQVLQQVAEKRAERMAGVKNYVIIQKVQGGMEAPFYYEEFTPEGTMGRLFRLVPIPEWQQQDPRNPAPGVSPQEVAAGLGYAAGMAAGAIGPQLIGTPIGQAMDPAAMDKMMLGLDQFLMAAATYDPGDGKAEAEDEVLGAAMFATRAVLGGRHTVFGGRDAYLLVAQGFSDLPEQQVGEATFVVDKISVWVDTEKFVQLQLRVAGKMKNGGESRPIGIELNEWEYKQVGPMYEPTRRLMGITGLMGGSQLDPKQKKEMEKAQADMQKLKEQLAAMPASQRAMIQPQIDKAEAQLALMTSKDIMTAETELMVYSINRGPPFYWKPTCPSLEGPGAASAPDFCTQ